MGVKSKQTLGRVHFKTNIINITYSKLCYCEKKHDKITFHNNGISCTSFHSFTVIFIVVVFTHIIQIDFRVLKHLP